MKTSEIARLISAELIGDPNVDIIRVADLKSASEGEIAFAESAAAAAGSNASCLIVPMDSEIRSSTAILRTKNPKLAFSIVAEYLHPQKRREPQIHPTAAIAPDAVIADGVFIDGFVCVGSRSHVGSNSQIRAGVKIGDDVTIGENCTLDPNVCVEDNCVIGSGVVLHSGVIIGTDGFGYVNDGKRHVKFPQIGTVVIENNVEIGANSCVDRGALGETRIGEGTKIDNLVQIAHNVSIGKRVIIAAQTGISGSTVIEDDCIIGGQVGMGDHALVKSGAVIGSQAGVLPGKIVRPGVWWGTPVQPLDEFKRQNAMVKGLARLREQVNDLKKLIENDGGRNK